MAKKSAVNRNERVQAPRQAVRRQARRAEGDRQRREPAAGRTFRSAPEAGGAAAQLVQDPHPQPLRGHGPSARLLSQAEDEPDRAARPRVARADPRPRQVELVGGSRNGQRPHRRSDRPHQERRHARPLQGDHAGLEDARARPRRAARTKATSAATTWWRSPARFPEFEIELKYFDGEPVIVEISRVSKPGRRVYSSIKDLKPVKNGLGISILSTPKGVMSDTAARDANVGGEVLCRVY